VLHQRNSPEQKSISQQAQTAWRTALNFKSKDNKTKSLLLYHPCPQYQQPRRHPGLPCASCLTAEEWNPASELCPPGSNLHHTKHPSLLIDHKQNLKNCSPESHIWLSVRTFSCFIIYNGEKLNHGTYIGVEDAKSSHKAYWWQWSAPAFHTELPNLQLDDYPIWGLICLTMDTCLTSQTKYLNYSKVGVPKWDTDFTIIQILMGYTTVSAYAVFTMLHATLCWKLVLDKIVSKTNKLVYDTIWQVLYNEAKLLFRDHCPLYACWRFIRALVP